MNHYTYNEILVGQEESFSVCITNEHVQTFRALTGDENLLHRDGEYAKAQGFSDVVVFGMLTTSFLSTLCGVWLPGENSLIYDLKASYPKPVYVGDELIISGKVVEKSDAMNMITVQWRIVKKLSNETAAKGTIRVRVRETL